MYGEAYKKLEEIISESEKKYNCKLYIDSAVGSMQNWLQVSVFIHGDRNVVNIVAIKIMSWQHNHLAAWENHYVYVYPAEDMEKYEEINKKAY